MKNKVIAPCGIDCFNCEFFEENITEEFRARIAAAYKVPKEELSCKGCTKDNLCVLLKLQGKTCKTHACAMEKSVDYCFNCDTFPCDKLMPLADGAARLPHNLKMYNLCMMKSIGIEAWSERAADIRKTYFGKAVKIGEGGSKEE